MRHSNASVLRLSRMRGVCALWCRGRRALMSRPVIRRLDPYFWQHGYAASMRPAFRRPTAQYAAATFTVDRLIEMLGTLRCVRPRERMRRCRPDSLSIDSFYACLRCAVTEDDIKFFEGNPARRYRIRELQRTGRQRHMAIVDRAGRETIFPVGESFIPHDSDVVLSSLVSNMTSAAMARWE